MIAEPFLSPHFPASKRRRASLRFIVEKTFAGRDGSLKGYTMAVFSRAESLDPPADPVVRLDDRRLRRDLESLYLLDRTTRCGLPFLSARDAGCTAYCDLNDLLGHHLCYWIAPVD